MWRSRPRAGLLKHLGSQASLLARADQVLELTTKVCSDYLRCLDQSSRLKVNRLSPQRMGTTMFANLKFKTALIALASIAVVPMTDSASAISVELARKCDALTAKAFPPREIGNPASGSAKGTGRDERSYYRKCVAKKGKMEERAK
jgi:hypothetical protein